LRLLQALSPELLAAALQNHLESLVSSTNLALPLDAPERLDTESKLKRGREETARRALEVVEMQSAALPDRQAGEILATGVVRVCGTLSGVESEGRVWEAGLKAVLRMLQDSESSGRFDKIDLQVRESCGKDSWKVCCRLNLGAARIILWLFFARPRQWSMASSLQSLALGLCPPYWTTSLRILVS